MHNIINGKQIAQKIKDDLKEKVGKLTIKPGLAVVLVGDDPASKVYVNSKIKACKEIGFYSENIILPENTTQEKLNGIIDSLNINKKINGILVQFPLPRHLSEPQVIEKISPVKDVDGLNPVNVGKLILGNNNTDLLLPCTAKGILTLIKSIGTDIAGKNAVVIGRSNLVGKPVSLLLLNNDATVTVCHSKTRNLKDYTKMADILVAAVGKPRLITGDMVKEGCIVIDAGTTKTKQGLVGDVDFEEASKVAGYITPVPGGVGPMTIASLMENTYLAYLKQTA